MTRAATGVNRQMNYQAKLLDASGQPVADGTYSMKFSLYDAATDGTRLWSATGTTGVPGALSVTVRNGLFSVLLGDTSVSGGIQNPLDNTINWNSDSLYLGVTVGSDAEMAPRKRLAAVPQAINAENLQGMYASGTANGGESLFAINQTQNNAAVSARTALRVSSKGTSNANDFLVIGTNDLGTDVFSVNRQGSVTSSGVLAMLGSATSTFSGNLSVAGNVSSSNANFQTLHWKNATGTNLDLSGKRIYADNTRIFDTVNTSAGVGFNALGAADDGFAIGGNAAFGYNALSALTSGLYNVALGYGTLKNSTSTSYNIAIGEDALSSFNGTNGYNIGIGDSALLNTQANGRYNIGIGSAALSGNVTGISNVALGYQALQTADASNNVGIGYTALTQDTTGAENTAIGADTMRTNATGQQNTAIGRKALYSSDGADLNFAGGYFTLYSNSSGARNTAIGANAGYSGTANTTEYGNTFIGFGAGLGTAGVNSSTAIGANARVSMSNALVLGGTGTDAVSVGIGTASPSSFTLQVAGSIGPNSTNLYDLGSPALSWRNLYASGTAIFVNGFWTNATGTNTTSTNFYATLANASGLSWTNATGTNTTSTNLYTSTVSAVNATTTNLNVQNFTSSLLPLVNNSLDIGSAALAWKNIYASGTINLGGDLMPNGLNASGVTAASSTFESAANFPSGAVGKDGFPIIAYHDISGGTKSLSIAHCVDKTCAAAATVTILDNTAGFDSGQLPSLAIGADGFPIISYYASSTDGTGYMKIVHCLNTASTTSEKTQSILIGNTGSGWLGSFSSIAIGIDHNPIFVYTSSSRLLGTNLGQLLYQHCTNQKCSTSDTAVVLASASSGGGCSEGTVGQYAHIMVPPDGRPFVAYYGGSSCGAVGVQGIKFNSFTTTTDAVANNDSFSINGLGSVNEGKFLSMTLDPNGLPLLAWTFDAGGNDAKVEVSQCQTSPCNVGVDWQTSIITGAKNSYNSGITGSTQIFLGADGLPVVVANIATTYWNGFTNLANGDPYVFYCTTLGCSSVSTTALETSGAFSSASGTTAFLLGDDSIGVFHYDTIGNVITLDRFCSTVGGCSASYAGSNLGSVGQYFYRIYGRELYAQQASLSGFDLAESYPSHDMTLEAGDVVAIDPAHPGEIIRADKTQNPILLGIISTKPGLLLTDWSTKKANVFAYPLALAGRVPIKVSAENGPIAVGDLLTISSVPGVAAKAIGPGQVIGRALASAGATSTIEAFVHIGYDAGVDVSKDAETIMQNDVVFAPKGEVNASSTSADSWGLVFRGSSFSENTSTETGFTLATNFLDVSHPQFTIKNASSTTIFALDQNGTLKINGDLILGGKLYLGGDQGAQTSTAISLDTSSPNATYVSTNANGWQSNASFDFAERYASPDQLEPGDVVVVSERESLHVQRALDAKQMVAGVISTSPAFVAGKADAGTFPVALLGRTPTKVSTMKGEIHPGDFLAPSSIPGVAMKATVAGPVIGQALEPYAGSDIGKIDLFINPIWWNGPDPAQTAAQSVSQVVLAATTSTDQITGKTYQGFALVVAGGTRVHVSYPSLQAYPNVQTTPRGEVDGGWWTDNYSDVGFDIIFKKPQNHDVTFAWRVDATNQDASVFLSDGTKAAIDPLTGQIVFGTVVTSTAQMTETDAATTTTVVSTPIQPETVVSSTPVISDNQSTVSSTTTSTAVVNTESAITEMVSSPIQTSSTDPTIATSTTDTNTSSSQNLP
ncbi:MAG TPA: hypothetical protein VFQ60_04180 [Patescibacteria group bacterium]|nr:hypothetical protein [Patescibacteria group bacterium]